MPDPYVTNGLAIINPYGGIWTNKVFKDADEALKYLRDYWGPKKDLSGFKLAYGRLEVNLEMQGGKPIVFDLPSVSQ